MNKIQQILDQSEEFIPGNELQVKLTLVALILNKHILIEDVPGMGKTTLVKFFAQISGLEFRRIQFTNDLLPSDVLGTNIFNKESGTFSFKKGPIFGELILADELNRASPKSQSSLLEVMEEKQVTIDGETHLLPDQFSLFATQNPRQQFGTHSLPESQLDRFLFKFSMGRLSLTDEKNLFQTGSRLEKIKSLQKIFSVQDLSLWRTAVKEVTQSEAFLDYLMRVLAVTRSSKEISGLSSRAGFDLIEATKAWAFLMGRNYVLPDDLQIIFPYVAAHRMYQHLKYDSEREILLAKSLIKELPIIKLA